MHADDASDEPGSGDPVATPIPYPDIIEAIGDTPLFLSQCLGLAEAEPGSGAGIRFAGIDGVPIDVIEAAGLPGIRIGGGEGAGFVFQRALDGKIVFVPDADYRGLATFTYTISDADGDEATLVATVNIVPGGSEVAFSDGSHHTVVPEGAAPIIIGSVAINELLSDSRPQFQVFESDGETPSRHFSVLGDKLISDRPLSFLSDHPLKLRVVAREDDQDIATGLLEVEIRQNDAIDPSAILAPRPAPRLALVDDGNHASGLSLAADDGLSLLLASLQAPAALGANVISPQDRTLAAIEQALSDLAARTADDQFQFRAHDDALLEALPPVETPAANTPTAELPAADAPIPQPDPGDTLGF